MFPLNRDIDRVNNVELGKCGGPSETYSAGDDGEEPHLGTLQKNCPAPDRLLLKRGAQVMLLKNLDAVRGLVNGARGVVVDFVRNMEAPSPPRLPLVQFEGGGEGGGSVTVPIAAAEWTVELGGRLVASRSQIPLKLAYALSIHKSQGMTISSVEVSLEGVFEYGQAYTALSRAVSLDRLRVYGFRPSVVRAHPRVIEFYSRLERAGVAGARASADAGPGAVPLHGGGSAATAPGPVAPLPLQPPTKRARTEAGAYDDAGADVRDGAVPGRQVAGRWGDGLPVTSPVPPPPPPPPPVPAARIRVPGAATLDDAALAAALFAQENELNGV